MCRLANVQTYPAGVTTFTVRRIDWLPILFLLPLMTLFAGLYVLPFIETVLTSFAPYDSSGVRQQTWTLANYSEFISDLYYQTISFRTFKIMVLVAVASAVAVYPIAIFINAQSSKVQAWILLAYVTPWLVNVTVKAFGWTLLLSPRGIINDALRDLGLVERPLALMFNELGTFIGLFHAQFIFVLLPVWAAVRGLDGNIIDAARNLGAGSRDVFFRIILPMTAPALAAGIILNMTLSLSAFTTPALLGGKRTKVLSYLSYEINLVELNWPLGAAVGIVLLFMALVPILLVGALGSSRTARR